MYKINDDGYGACGRVLVLWRGVVYGVQVQQSSFVGESTERQRTFNLLEIIIITNYYLEKWKLAGTE